MASFESSHEPCKHPAVRTVTSVQHSEPLTFGFTRDYNANKELQTAPYEEGLCATVFRLFVTIVNLYFAFFSCPL